MNLRTTTLLIVGLTFVGLSLVLSFTLRVVLMRHFEEIEQQNVILNLERAEGLIAAESDSLARISREWAGSEPMVELQQKDVRALTDLNIALILWFDPAGEVGYSLWRDGDSASSLPETLLKALQPGGAYLPAELTGEVLQGMITLQDQPMLLVSQPLQDANGKPAGVLVAGHTLDREELQRLGGIIQLPIDLLPYPSAVSNPDYQAALQAFQGEQPAFVSVLDDVRIAGFALLTNPKSEPSYLLRIEQSRLFYLSGQRVMGLIRIALLTVGVVFAIITILFLELMVFSRLARLSREVTEIRSGEFLAKRVTVSGRDELARLGQNINAMLDALSQAQERRLEAQDELHSRVNDLLALNDTTVLLLSRLDAPNTLENVCRLAVEKFGIDMAWIGTPAPERSVIQPVAVYGSEIEQLAPLALDAPAQASQPAARALLGAQVVVDDQPAAAAGVNWSAAAFFPLSIEPEHLSVLNVYSRDPQFFTSNRLQILEAFSNLASISLQNARLFHQVRNGRKRLEMLSRRLVELQEEERKRIALELHDEIGQILTGLNLMLGVDLTLFSPELRTRLENARKLVNDLIGRVRQMSLTLRPAMLDDLGLLPTLLWHFENYTRQSGIRVNFHHSGIEGQRFSPNIETAAYRVAQEALTNVARHAGVEEVLVQIWTADRILNVQVEDAGAGFDVEKATQAGGTFGLLGMQERAISLRGNLTIDSQPGRGTSLLIQLPLEGRLERRNYERNHSAGR